jgi:hypothetical protein
MKHIRLWEYLKDLLVIVSRINMHYFESSNHFMVLDAISKGLTSVHKITSVTKLDNEEIESIIIAKLRD